MTATDILILVAAAAVCYLCGGLNGAIMLSSACYHEDIREKGSGNPGFTNFKRVYGLNGITWAVLIIDMLKTALPVLGGFFLLADILGSHQTGAAFAGLFCMLGHCFPVWYGFKGGKAFIAGFATSWFVDWRMALIATAIFFLLLFTIKYMSVASCCYQLSCPISLALLGPKNWLSEVLCILCAVLVIARHYPNFVKLAHGKESKFSLSKKAAK